MDYYNDFEEGFVDTSFGKIYYKHHSGTGKRILFLHGLGATTRVWLRLVGYLPSELDIYLIDLLGHGKSDAPDINYALPKQVQAVGEFVENVGLSDFYMFGHSYGGWIEVLYALSSENASGFIFEDVAGFKDYLDELKSNPEKWRARKEMMKKEIAYSNSERIGILENILDQDSEEYEFTESDLSRISKPVLIIWGRDDDLVEASYGKIMNQSMKQSSLIIIEGVGHTPHYTNSEEVAECIGEFLEKNV